MIARPDVDALLQGPLGPWLDEQALVRHEAHALAVTRWKKAAMVGVPVALFAFILFPDWYEFIGWAAMGIAGIAYAWGNAPRTKAMKRVKIGINEAIARALDIEYRAEVEPGDPFRLSCTFGMLPSHDRSNFEDMWHGQIADRSFSLHEAHLLEEKGSGKDRRFVTVFRGAIMSLDFTRDFHGVTLVERAGRHKALFGFGGHKDYVTFDGHRLDYVDLVHPDFENAFCVFSDDQVEARYLVHPVYVERLIAVQQAFSGQAIRALFSGGNLVIVVETDDMFESGAIDSAEDRSRIERTVEQFASLADLAQSLNEPER